MRLSLDDQYESMPWEKIDAVVFDVGNVLMAFRPEQAVAEILPEQPEIHRAVLNRTVRTPRRRPCSARAMISLISLMPLVTAE